MNATTVSKATMIAAGQSLKEREYWLEKLSGNFQKSCFYYDYRKTNETGYEPGFLEDELPGEVFAAIFKLAKGSFPKMYMILTATLVELVYKYTANQDIILGTSIYKQDVKGEFINTVLPLRHRRTPTMTFKDLLKQVRRTVIEANENQNFPISTLFYELDNLDRDNEFPLFDIVLLLENIHSKEYVRHTNPSLYFSFTAVDNTMHLNLEYNSLLYQEHSLKIIVRHYFTLLGQMLTHVDLPLDNIQLLSPAEKEQLLVDFNNTTSPYPEDRNIHELFEEQVEKTPGNAAVAFDDKHFTYREFNETANRLARLLREKGVKPDTPVGLLLESSFEMVVGILAILKAGGAYLPLDITYPPERISYMLKESETLLLLTREHFPGLEKFAGQLIYPGTGILDQGDGSNLHPTAGPGDLAYIIYTSGSSGKPKGTAIEHRSILNYIQWRIKAYGHTAEDASFQLVSVSFDGFCANFYPTLLTGGKVVLENEEKWAELSYIKNIIRQEQVTNFSVVPSMYKFILQGGKKEDFQSLRFVALAGEKADQDLIECSRELIPHLRLINEYGPTETSVATAAHFDMTPWNLTVIGKPAFNQSLYILDDEQHLKPMGVPGELFISGKGLMRGYINRPELIHEKLIPNPFKSGEKMYRTGDLARWLPGGEIELLGRMDDQVKVRGFRIELGEIENQLRRHKDITDAVIMVLDNIQGDSKGKDPGDKYLYAWVVTNREIKDAEIRDFLATRLPDYMIPAKFTRIEKIPLMPNGKVDRKALPLPQFTTEEIYAPPNNEIEEKLVEMWADLLELDKNIIGINHNFFNIGGHSLKASMLVSKIQEQWGVQIPLVDIFKTPTIRELVPHIIKKDPAGTETQITTGEKKENGNMKLIKEGQDSQKILLLIHPASGITDPYIQLTQKIAPEWNVWGINADPLLNYTPQKVTIPELAEKYIREVKNIQPHGPYYLAGWCVGGNIGIEMTRQLEAGGDTVGFLGILNAMPPSEELFAFDNPFTLESELKLVTRYFHDKKILKAIKKTSRFEDLWPLILSHIEDKDIDIRKLKEYAEELKEGIPNIEQLNRSELIYYINMIRVLGDARYMYIPPEKVHSPAYFFKARESQYEDIFQWNKFSYQPMKLCEVPGDHYSMMEGENAAALADTFNSILEASG